MGARAAYVLVAEDDALQREVLVELLALAGYRAVPAATPGEVLARLEEAPDVLLLDLVGMATAGVRAALARLPRPPRVVVASGDPCGADEAAALGAGAFLLKPFGMAQLLETLGAALADRPGPEVSPAPTLVCAP